MMFTNDVVVAAAVAAAAVIVFLFFWMMGDGTKQTTGRRYPPSASTLSLLGAVLRGGIGVLPEHFMKTAEKLGPLISCNFGGRRVVVLNGMDAITEAFLRNSEAFADRPEFWTEANILNRDLRGIIFSRYNDAFKKHRRLCLAILKEFGFGVNSLSEIRILRGVESLKEAILKFDGSPFDPKPLTVLSTFSIVSGILFGEAFVASDACRRLSETLSLFSRNIGHAVGIAPLLRFLPNFRRQMSAVVQCQRDIFIDIEKGIECSRSVECEDTFVRRFIEMQGSAYDRQDLLYIVRDLCFGSSDTVSTTLLWALVALANHPEVQTRFQREIDDAVPRDRPPSLDDRPRLPYTEAVILEVMRRHSLVPFYIPHATLRDAEVLGCCVPRGCIIFANAFSAHMDPKYWIDPENFRPERYLDEEDMITGREKVIPFGLGKRSCLGEMLGRHESFLFLTSLIQSFDIRPPEGQASIGVKEVISIGVFPSIFELRMIPRIQDASIKK